MSEEIQTKIKYFCEGVIVMLILTSFMIFIDAKAWIIFSLVLGLFYAAIKYAIKGVIR